MCKERRENGSIWNAQLKQIKVEQSRANNKTKNRSKQ